MTTIKKEKFQTLSVSVSEAEWYTVGGMYDRELRKRVGGYQKLTSAKVNVETRDNWVSLSISEAEKLAKVLKKAIKKAKTSSTAAKGAE